MIKESTKRQPEILNVPQVSQFRQITKPITSQQNKKKISAKLQLEKHAIGAAKQREKADDLFIKFVKNPFSHVAARDDNAHTHKNKQIKDQDLLINQILNSRASRPIKPQFLDLRNTFSEFIHQNQKVSTKILTNIIGTKRINMNPQNNQQKVQKEEENTNLLNINNIQSILKIKDQNFFLKKNVNINIFQYRGDQEYQHGIRSLQKLHFSFTSVIQKVQKIKIPIYRDLSRMGRKIAMGAPTGTGENIIDYLDSYQLSFKTKQLLFHDLLSVASGRLSSQFLNKTLNFDFDNNNIKQGSQTSSQQASINVFYRQNEVNDECKLVNADEQKQQIDDYKKLQNNQAEEQYLKKCIQYKDYINNLIDKEVDLYQKTIKDKSLHVEITGKINEQLLRYVKFDEKNLENDMEKDRLIRKNKSNKSKNERIRYQTMFSCLQMVNEIQDQVNNQKVNPTLAKKTQTKTKKKVTK